MTDEELVRNLIAHSDEIRLQSDGGYPSIWKLRDGLVIWADVDYDSAPMLTIQELHQFIEENLQLILDEIDGDFQTYEQKRKAVETYFVENPSPFL
jgi:hypothetical protein